MKAGAPKGNKNAEKWTYEDAEKLLLNCLKTAKDQNNKGNDFIGEVAQQNETTLSTLDYLCNKYPDLSIVYEQVKSNCEANCFRNGKTGTIVPSLAIMNLKSNHGWTDRLDQTTKGKEITQPPVAWVDESSE